MYCYAPNDLARLLATAMQAAREAPTAPLHELVERFMSDPALNPLNGRYAIIERPQQGLTYMVLSADHHDWTTDPSVNINTENADELIRDAAGMLLKQLRQHYAALPTRH